MKEARPCGGYRAGLQCRCRGGGRSNSAATAKASQRSNNNCRMEGAAAISERLQACRVNLPNTAAANETERDRFPAAPRHFISKCRHRTDETQETAARGHGRVGGPARRSGERNRGQTLREKHGASCETRLSCREPCQVCCQGAEGWGGGRLRGSLCHQGQLDNA